MSYLFEEPSNLLKQEVREPATYNAIIQAVANGSTKISQIAMKTGLEVSACAAFLKNLMDLGIIQKEHPLEEPRSRKSLYRIQDNMFRFWYRLFRSITLRFRTGWEILPSDASNRTCRISWGRFLKPSVCNGFGGRMRRDACPCFLMKLGAGGGRTRAGGSRPSWTSWHKMQTRDVIR